MKVRMTAAVLVLILAHASAALAQCDPDMCDDLTSYSPPPPVAAAAPEPAPVPEAPPAAPAPEAPPGYYKVTLQFAGDVITVSGPTTTYGSQFADVANPNSYARVVDKVAAGQSSSFDGRSANTRATRTDGKAVSGVFYESVTWDPQTGAITLISYTFVQNDSETASPPAPSTTRQVPAPEPLKAGPAQIPAAEPIAVMAVVPDTSAPAGEPALTPGDVDLTPHIDEPPVDLPEEDVMDRFEREPSTRPAIPPQTIPTQPSPTAQAHSVHSYIALGPQGDELASIDVLRGRRIELWIRGVADGRAARVVSWRLVSGDVNALGPVTGSGDAPFVAQWLAVTGGSPFTLRFDAVVETAAGTQHTTAVIDVSVRSPAIVE